MAFLLTGGALKPVSWPNSVLSCYMSPYLVMNFWSLSTPSRELPVFHIESLCCVLLALIRGYTKLYVPTRKIIRHGMFSAFSLWGIQNITTEYSEIVPHTPSFFQSMSWLVLPMMQVDSVRVILHFSDASVYRKDKVMPPRSVQAPSGQYMESISWNLVHGITYVTDLHIQIS